MSGGTASDVPNEPFLVLATRDGGVTCATRHADEAEAQTVAQTVADAQLVMRDGHGRPVLTRWLWEVVCLQAYDRTIQVWSPGRTTDPAGHALSTRARVQ